MLPVLPVKKVTFDLWTVKHPMRDVLKCAIVDSGVLSVICILAIVGVMKKLKLSVVNLDSLLVVRNLWLTIGSNSSFTQYNFFA